MTDTRSILLEELEGGQQELNSSVVPIKFSCHRESVNFCFDLCDLMNVTFKFEVLENKSYHSIPLGRPRTQIISLTSAFMLCPHRLFNSISVIRLSVGVSQCLYACAFVVA